MASVIKFSLRMRSENSQGESCSSGNTQLIDESRNISRCLVSKYMNQEILLFTNLATLIMS
jgi:hypothetical protein